ncbi:MAG: 3'-5' exonuclease [Ideonella sp. WA131b]|nr:3'-5' exonuclease [Ideonella sp. WA131b]
MSTMAAWWQRLLGGDRELPESRWVVLDVETSGLDARRARLLAIAALGVHRDGPHWRIVPADSFEVVLRYEPDEAGRPDRDNILLHGIGVGAQRGGVARPEALQRFAGFVGDAPLVAFHAAFDRTMIERACRAAQLPVPANPWLDLEPLAGVLMPQLRARSLDEWMAELGIPCAARHEAAADTLATAELLLRLAPRLNAEIGGAGFAAAQKLAAQRRWVGA